MTGRAVPATPGRPRFGRRARVVAAALTVVVATAACSEPLLPDVEDEAGAADDGVPDPAAPEREQLAEELVGLAAHLRTIREQYAVAADAGSVQEARAAGQRALELLVDEPGSADDGTAGLLPSVSDDRGDVDLRTDRFTRLSSAAREAGGSLGTATLDLLRDPMAGDLGAWERDPEGLLATADAVAQPTTPLEQLDVEVLQLDGDALRAVAWTQLLAEAPDADLAAAYAERADLHVELIQLAAEGLVPDDAEPSS